MPDALLRQGNQGTGVAELQRRLNSHLKLVPALEVDGKFGPKTEVAVRQFQTARGLQVDGLVGPQTKAALNQAPIATSPAAPFPTPPDPTVPAADGHVTTYSAMSTFATSPRILYVNGIQTSGQAHADTVKNLSIVTERQVIGIFNQSTGVGQVKGFAGDLFQCLTDWGSIAGTKLVELTNLGLNTILTGARDFVKKKLGMTPSSDPVNLAGAVREAIPESSRLKIVEARLKVFNKATASLFSELKNFRNQKQLIVAHSQGNLIVSDALWAMVIVYGEDSLAHMQVYSLASPSPAWPLGIRYRRKVYGHTNDLVTFADPHNWTILTSWMFLGIFNRTAGDWRKHGAEIVGIKPHDIKLNMEELNFTNRIRGDVGLPPIPGMPTPK